MHFTTIHRKCWQQQQRTSHVQMMLHWRNDFSRAQPYSGKSCTSTYVFKACTGN